MSDKIVKFSGGKRYPDLKTPILDRLGLYDIGDGLSVSSYLSTDEQKSFLKSSLRKEYPKLTSDVFVDPDNLEVWRDGDLVALCELKGWVDRHDDPEKTLSLKGAITTSLVYSIPSESSKSICQKMAMTIFILTRQAIRSASDRSDSKIEKIYLDFSVGVETRNGNDLFDVFSAELEGFSVGVKTATLSECFCYISKLTKQ